MAAAAAAAADCLSPGPVIACALVVIMVPAGRVTTLATAKIPAPYVLRPHIAPAIPYAIIASFRGALLGRYFIGVGGRSRGAAASIAVPRHLQATLISSLKPSMATAALLMRVNN